jgi:alkylation response protein AidB-like acyl-CoA dehydrogenase
MENVAAPATPSATLDVDAVVAELGPVLEARGDEIETARRLPADLSAALARAGVYRSMAPAALGGLEAAPGETTRLFERLARHDASAAWVGFIGATTATQLARLPDEIAREVLADPDTLITGVFAPKGRARLDGDGFIVDGHWQWGSGCQNARWITAGCMLVGDDGPLIDAAGAPRQHAALVPAEEVEILDTWYASGLCGTGSTDFRMRGVRVPAERMVGLRKTAPPDRPLYRFPQFCLLGLGIAGVALGIARRALDELIDLAEGKVPTGSRKRLADRTDVQMAVARAEAEVRSARAWLHDTIETAWARAEAGEALDVPARRDLRLATTHAVRAATRAVDAAYELGGGTSVYRTSRLQRCFRDVHVTTQHIMVGPGTLELTGRLFLGLETSTAML